MLLACCLLPELRTVLFTKSRRAAPILLVLETFFPLSPALISVSAGSYLLLTTNRGVVIKGLTSSGKMHVKGSSPEDCLDATQAALR